MSLELRYHPCVEQRALADTFNKSVDALLPMDRLHVGCQEDGETWSKLRDIGLFSIGQGENTGGSGLGAAEEALIVMKLGRCLAGPSVLATIGATHAVPTADRGGVRRTASAYRHGARIIVVGDAGAEAVLLRDGVQAAIYPYFAAASPIDCALWHANLHEGATTWSPAMQFDGNGLLRLRLIDAAALAGIASAALDMGVGYAGERRQFGRLIGSFQAVKHHCANMAIAARNAHDQVTFASVAIDNGREDAELQVDCALLVAGLAALRNTATNIQIHGGIGFSEEASPHLLLKRTHLLLAVAGGLEPVTARIAESGAGTVNRGYA